MELIDILGPLAILTVILMISILWTNWIGAPWFPTSMSKVYKMLQMANVGPDDLLYDLGCGDGRIITTAAHHYGARAVGIEIDPLRFIWCQILITVLGLRGRVHIKYGNFFNIDLSEADVVTCYLLAETNLKLENKLMQELSSDSRIISHSFIFPQLQLMETDDEHNLYLYRPNS